MADWNQRRESRSGWQEDGLPLSVALVAPKECGKTAYLAALRHLSTRAIHMVDGACYRFGDLRGCGPRPASERATEHLEEVYASVKEGETPPPTVGWHAHRAVAERLRNGSVARREVFLLDSMGGHLFPEAAGRTPFSAEWEAPEGQQPRLETRLEELDILDAERALMVFVNEPTPTEGAWRVHHQVPAALAEYVAGVTFNRVVLYVACADTLFPRFGNLRVLLNRYNASPASSEALRRYIHHFRGSPHCDFTISLINYLAHSGALSSEGPTDSAALSVFWGSSFGVDRYSGRPNIGLDMEPDHLHRRGSASGDDWTPVEVLEPILWCAGLLARGE